MTSHQPPSHLPSLPQVLAQILDAMQGEAMSFQQLADIIHQDPAISARLLAVANSTSHASTQRCQTIERALLVLGLDTVKTIVITAAIRQFFNSFGRNHQGFLKAFWQRSLMMANLSRSLAQLTGSCSPDQAYLGGLLADVGQLVLLQQHGQHYLEHFSSAANDQELIAAEQAVFDASHNQVGAELLGRWQIDPVMVSALRQHHDEPRQIVNAQPLVKVINLASLLSLPDQGAPQAGMLFDFSEELVDELRAQAQQQTQQLAQALEIDTDSPSTHDSQRGYEQLGLRLGQIWELEQTRAELARARDQAQLHQTVQRVVSLMIGVEQPVLFLLDSEGANLTLAGAAPAATKQSLPLEPAHSCISEALLQQRILSSGDNESSQLGAFDTKLLRLLDHERLLCVPLIYKAQALGVLALGITGPTSMPLPFLQALAHEVARALAEERTDAEAATQIQRRIDEAVHEAGNPLSIIGNYLEVLRLNLQQSEKLETDIDLLQEEIQRVGNILLRLKAPQQSDSKEPSASLDINQLIQQLAPVLESSLFAIRQVQLELSLSATTAPLSVPASYLKQILLNLLKNAAEALPAGGQVRLTTATDVYDDGALFTALTIEDNGPGIPLEVMNQLFSPIASTKGDDHAGLGLSITKRLVDDLNGRITCESGSWGTRFQVLIPQ